MRFIVDECTGPAVARWLRQHKHNVFSVYEEARGLDDEGVLQKAIADNRILITNDKDFGEMIFREGKAHRGVILLRLEDERASALRTRSGYLNGYWSNMPITLPTTSLSPPRLVSASPALKAGR